MRNDSWPTIRLSLLLQLQHPEADQAWTDFDNRYRPPIFRMIRDAFNLQDADAHDITQVVLLKLIRAMKTFKYDPDKQFRAWLRTVARNAVRDAFRERKRNLAHGTGDSQVRQMLEERVAASDTLSEALTDAMHRDMLSDAERLVQQRVEPHTWQAYVAACAGSPSREIAQRMGMSTAAVYKAKSKVIRMIREEISMLLVGDD